MHRRNKYLWRIIKKIEKSDKKAACPACGDTEDWDHVLLCEQNKNKREEWAKELEIKLKKVEQYKYAE